MPHTAYIALGSNLGNREENLRRAMELLPPKARVVTFSSASEYPAVDSPPNSPAFLNAAARVETELTPRELLDHLLEIERQMGRQRSVKNAPRIIDLDLLLYDAIQSDDKHLLLPHPRMHERRFVLEPLAMIAPQLRHPVIGVSMAGLLAKLSAT